MIPFEYAAHYLDKNRKPVRWPEREQGPLTGNVNDLADAVERLSLSERQAASGTKKLEQVVRAAAGLLADYAGGGPRKRVAKELHQEAGEQTGRMAPAICVSAFVLS